LKSEATPRPHHPRHQPCCLYPFFRNGREPLRDESWEPGQGPCPEPRANRPARKPSTLSFRVRRNGRGICGCLSALTAADEDALTAAKATADRFSSAKADSSGWHFRPLPGLTASPELRRAFGFDLGTTV